MELVLNDCDTCKCERSLKILKMWPLGLNKSLDIRKTSKGWWGWSSLGSQYITRPGHLVLPDPQWRHRNNTENWEKGREKGGRPTDRQRCMSAYPSGLANITTLTSSNPIYMEMTGSSPRYPYGMTMTQHLMSPSGISKYGDIWAHI